ncbi:MAG: Dabb family protein [Actinomycetia bacterium]|nr:Dabb family protein [Actinomycetes bacterium]
MIRHIVLLDLSETATDDDRQAILDALATLPGRIPSIRNYVWGADAGLAEGNAEITAVADFDDVAGYEEYRDHDAHKQVIGDYIKPVLANRTAIQIEF